MIHFRIKVCPFHRGYLIMFTTFSVQAIILFLILGRKLSINYLDLQRVLCFRSSMPQSNRYVRILVYKKKRVSSKNLFPLSSSFLYFLEWSVTCQMVNRQSAVILEDAGYFGSVPNPTHLRPRKSKYLLSVNIIVELLQPSLSFLFIVIDWLTTTLCVFVVSDSDATVLQIRHKETLRRQ